MLLLCTLLTKEEIISLLANVFSDLFLPRPEESASNTKKASLTYIGIEKRFSDTRQLNVI